MTDGHRFEVTYTAVHIRQSIRQFFGHRLNTLLDWKIRTAGVVVCAAVAAKLYAGGPVWLGWFAAAGLLLVTIFFYALYRAHIRQSMDRLRDMKRPVATVVVSEQSLTVSSELGSSTLPWSAFSGSLESAHSLLVIVRQSSLITIPKAGVEAAALQFIRDRVAGATPRGGR